MNDDRLTHLLTEATDLRPSAELRARIADQRPHSRRATPWFALSGATASFAVMMLALMPRESAAESLLHRAAANQGRTSARLREFTFAKGTWKLGRQGILAGAWSRFDERSGSVTIETPTEMFQRSGLNGPVFQSKVKTSAQEGLSLEEHLRFLRRLGREIKITATPERTESGRTVKDVIIDMAGREERETVTLDVKTELPLRLVAEAKLKRGWLPNSRIELSYPGPQPGSDEFWVGIDRSQIVSLEGLADYWVQRLAPVQQTLRLSGGTTLKIRDLRILPSGDVVMLYTGPANLLARLEGHDGTPYARAWFDPNNGRANPRNRPPIVLQGEPLRGLWFVPLTEGTSARGRIRLELEGGGPPRPDFAGDPDALKADAPGQKGIFTLHPLQESSELPAWANALDNQLFRGDFEGQREEARITAAYDHWLDAGGRSIEGAYRLQPEAGRWLPPGPPRPGLRHDPRASAAAAKAFREMMAHAEARGKEINPQLSEPYLERLDREARGE